MAVYCCGVIAAGRQIQKNGGRRFQLYPEPGWVGVGILLSPGRPECGNHRRDDYFACLACQAEMASTTPVLKDYAVNPPAFYVESQILRDVMHK